MALGAANPRILHALRRWENLTPEEVRMQRQQHDLLYPSDSDDNPEDQDDMEEDQNHLTYQNGLQELEGRYARGGANFALASRQLYQQVYPSTSVQVFDEFDDMPPLVDPSDSDSDGFRGDNGYSSDESEEGEPRIYLVSDTGGLTPLNRL